MAVAAISARPGIRPGQRGDAPDLDQHSETLVHLFDNACPQRCSSRCAAAHRRQVKAVDCARSEVSAGSARVYLRGNPSPPSGLLASRTAIGGEKCRCVARHSCAIVRYDTGSNLLIVVTVAPSATPTISTFAQPNCERRAVWSASSSCARGGDDVRCGRTAGGRPGARPHPASRRARRQ